MEKDQKFQHQHNAADSGAHDGHNMPDQGSLYHKMHWGAYKGHVRGLIRGVIVGGAIGAMIGIAFMGLLAVPAIAGAIGLTATAGMGTALLAGFAGLGSILAAELMGRIGNASGNVAAQLAELELRERYPEIPEISPDSPEPGFGHHSEVPPDRDRGKFFHGRVGLAGMLFGGGFGAMLGLGGVGAELSLGLGATATAAGAAGIAGIALPILLPMAIGSLFGLSFGVNRSLFKSVFNFTDNLLDGKVTGPTAADIAKDKERYRIMGESSEPAVITSLQRQEEFHRLYNGYFKQAFKAAFAGNARGLLGGFVAGGLTGALLGVVAAFAFPVIGITAIAAPVLIGTFATVGTLFGGTKFFNEASFEAAGHSHVHDIHHERLHAMQKGKDLSFEMAAHNIEQRRSAEPSNTPPGQRKKSLFNTKVGLIMSGIGALLGAVIAPVTSGVLGHVFHAAHIGGTVTTAASATVFSLIGGIGFGLGPAITERLHNFADTVYLGTFFPGDAHPEIKTEGKIPLMSPRSHLAGHFAEHLAQKGHFVSGPEIEEHIPQTNPLPSHSAQYFSGPPTVQSTMRAQPKPRSELLNRGEAQNFHERLEQQAQQASDLALGASR